MKQSSESMYLDLLKKTLSFSLWSDPPVSVGAFNYHRPTPKRQIVSFILKLLKMKDLDIVRNRNFSEEERAEGMIWPSYADTMIGLKRLDNLQSCIELVLREGIEGDLIETGVWRGGACIFMRGVLAAYQDYDRKVFVADSFEGLPPPDTSKWPEDAGDTHYREKYLSVSKDQVELNFKRYELLDERVIFIKGFFADSLPTAPIERLSILRLDGDMYGSTMDVLECLYPKLSVGGFCIIDDYALKGCKAAVDDYRRNHGIESKLISVDWSGRYWRKS